MRVLVMFDLPMVTDAERSAYTHFRKALIQEGFLMMQQSVYCKLALTPTAAEMVRQRVIRIKPEMGILQLLIITEKQYVSMEYLLGGPQTEQADDLERLRIY